jgi:hypothetical protein
MNRVARMGAVVLGFVGIGALASACSAGDEGAIAEARAQGAAGAGEQVASTEEAYHTPPVGGIRKFKILSLLDDTCGIWVNGAYRDRLDPNGETDWIFVGPNPNARTNILVRCSDIAVYGTSVEAVHDWCAFKLDEEGGGLRTEACG